MSFELFGKGLGTRDIAQQLHLSVHTIETHRQRIKNKLEISGSNKMVKRAAQWTWSVYKQIDKLAMHSAVKK